MAPLPPVRWLNETANIAPGRPIVIASVGGGHKSWLAQTAAVDAARGMPWGGRFPWREGGLAVAYVDYEQGELETRRRFQALAQGTGMALHLGHRLGYDWQPIERWSRKRDPRVLDRINDLVMSEGERVIDLVIVDSLLGCNPGVDENSADVSEPLILAAQSSETTGATFLFLDHVSPKGPTAKKTPLELLASQRGHSSKLGASGTLFVASPGPVETTALVTCVRSQNAPRRLWPAPFLFELQQPWGGEAGICSDAPVAAPQTKEKRAPPDKLAVLREAIAITVRECPCMSKNEIFKAVGGNRGTVIALISTMVAEGALVPVPGGYEVPKLYGV